MRVFVLRARAAPTTGRDFLAAVGGEAHTEVLAHVLINAILLAQSHRADVQVHLVLESSRDFSRTVSFDSNALQDFGGFHEQPWLARIARALDASQGMGKEDRREVEPGLAVRTVSFEKLVRELAQSHPLFVLDRKGTAIRGRVLPANPCFVLTDHVPMPKKSFHTLKRLGAEKLSLGPRMLFASQCIVLIHNGLDCCEP